MKIKAILLLSILMFLVSCGSSSSDSENDQCGGVVEISENAMVNGSLQSGDCTINDFFAGANDPSFVDQYRVTLSTAGTLQITLRSPDFDAFLFVLDTADSCASGCDPLLVLATDDDSGGGLNGTDSQLSIALNPGSYIIAVNNFAPLTGIYSLETVF
ncbi:MAG: PPC domain-containing protein [Pseudomonadota bacterium]